MRRICGDFPEVTERLSHGSPTFFIRDKHTLCTVHDNHHGAHGVAIRGKHPGAIAIAIAAELLVVREASARLPALRMASR